MITEDILSDTYAWRVVARDADRIYTTQANILRQNFSDERSGGLANFLVTRPFTSEGSPGKQTYHFRIFTYLRFLDIWHSGRKKAKTNSHRIVALYNRIVWCILYNQTLPDIRYGYTKDIRDSIRHELQQAVKP